jgi:hypothetical protein
MSTSIARGEARSDVPRGARPPASATVPTLGVAVVVGPVVLATDVDQREATRVSLLAAVDAVGHTRTILAGPIEMHDLALEFGVGFIASDGTWDDGVRLALSIAPTELVALAPHDGVIVASRLREAVTTLGIDDAWVAGPVWGGPVGVPRGDEWFGPGCVVRVSIALRAMRGGDTASAAWMLRADGWSCRIASGPVMAAQGDVRPALSLRQAVLAGSAVLRATLSRSSPLWDASCARPVRAAAACAAGRHVVGLATAVFVAVTAVAVAWGWLPPAEPSQAVVLLVAAGMISAAGASSIDISVRTVARGIVGGASPGAGTHPPRVGRTAVLGRPVAVALTLLVEVALVVRAGVLQALPGRPSAAYRADLVALAVGVAVLVPLLVSLRVIVRARPRRGSTRVSVSMPARIDGRSGVAVDIGARGLAVRTDALLRAEAMATVGSLVSVVLVHPAVDLCVPAVVERVVASDDGRPGRFVLGLSLVASPPTEGTMAFQRMWVDRMAVVVREQSPWELGDQVTSRQSTGPIRVASAVTAVVVALAFAPPYPVSASSPGHTPGTRSALPFAADPETSAPGRAAPGGMIRH